MPVDTNGHTGANGDAGADGETNQAEDDDFVSMREMRIYVVEAKGTSLLVWNRHGILADRSWPQSKICSMPSRAAQHCTTLFFPLAKLRRSSVDLATWPMGQTTLTRIKMAKMLQRESASRERMMAKVEG